MFSLTLFSHQSNSSIEFRNCPLICYRRSKIMSLAESYGGAIMHNKITFNTDTEMFHFLKIFSSL